LTAYFDFPAEHWRQIKTTNPVESSFAPIKMRLKKAKRIISETSALGLVFQLMLRREARWRRIDYPELVVEVIERGKCGKGLRRKDEGRV
ncbi:MAG: transposase, partial [candidate division WOR-3 bacterium]